jgi:hypothetical protein
MVTRTTTDRLVSAMQWYAVLGAPLAWAVQLVLGYYYTQAACGRGDIRLGHGIHAPEAALAAAMALIAAGAWATAVILRRGTSKGRVADPIGRVRFLADVGLVAGAIFFALIAFTGAGEIAIPECR